jgi:hypothetical protein
MKNNNWEGIMNNIKRTYQYLIFVVALNLLPLSSAHALLIDLKMPRSEIALDVYHIFNVDVIAKDVFSGLDPLEEVLAFGFDIFISDTSIVNLWEVEVAAPFDDKSGLLPNTDVAGSVFPGIANDSTNDTILLATLRFLVLSKGEVSLGITSDLTDINEGLIFSLDGSKDISSSIVVSIPEPNALLLIGIGLAGLGYTRRRARLAPASSSWRFIA